ncbi:non-hydrolyzing UDP-N-acetylglucosamine 2-epimerase [Reinekea marinisedimentorum]|uniref:UDP-N-acetylglucosamine 2-epimerase (Non-hydrolysing) n=1 Tax=Reinekea marinisedimentorum TaxID=230495 RepID=A0A4R3I6T5_9GAMM|nr:UDP-N-acetylglucosamine 2-epimerase (non-hydrolyzing) [Reinekea marinisedimentorum]TCS41696.1 UDP-N-acetylglucosamine 2-epimerase (non-hydrolysing) [Reinekea marinisedimentorum]
MHKLEIVIGTKAQLVKMAPIMRELEQQSIPYKFTLTGQHENTINDLISSFQISTKPELFTTISERDTTNSVMKWFLSSMWKIAKEKKSPNKIVVSHGDTLSTLLAAIYAKKIGAQFAHIEAGLRSFNIFNPFPEEIVRVLTSKLTTMHFAPGEWAANNIKSNSTSVINTKLNTIIDSLRYALADKPEKTRNTNKSEYAVASLHRFENLKNGDRLLFIIDHIEKVSELVPVKFVLHPVTVKELKKRTLFERLEKNPRVELTERMNYVKFTHLLYDSNFLITDGGSNQEEAFYMGLPCLLMRSHTERTEGINSNNMELSNYNPDTIMQFAHKYSKYNWYIKNLENVYPSKVIVENLKKVIDAF